MRLYGNTLYSTIHYTLFLSGFGVASDQVSDLFQDLLERLLEDDGKALRTYQGRDGCSFAGWLKSVAIRHVYSFIRAQKLHVSTETLTEATLHCYLDRVDPAAEAPDAEIQEEQLASVKSALPLLNEREHLVYQLYYRDDRPRSEICEMLGLDPNHVDQLLYRIRKKCRDQLKNEGTL